MTNVPQGIRDIWTKAYVIFDKYYRMPNTDDGWVAFWDECGTFYANATTEAEKQLILALVNATGEFIGERMKQGQMVP